MSIKDRIEYYCALFTLAWKYSRRNNQAAINQAGHYRRQWFKVKVLSILA